MPFSDVDTLASDADAPLSNARPARERRRGCVLLRRHRHFAAVRRPQADRAPVQGELLKGALQPTVNSIGEVKLAHVYERVFFITVELTVTSLSPLQSILPV